MNAILHELRNQLAIAVANVEAFIDGKLEPTPRRLRSVSDALSGIDGLLSELARRRSTPLPEEDEILAICAIISNEVVAIASARVGGVVNDLLLNAIRHAPPGAAIVVDCRRENNENFEVSVSNETARRRAHGVMVTGGTISIVSGPGDGVTFTVRLSEAIALEPPTSFARSSVA